LTRGHKIISRIILLAVIAVISGVAYFVGSGAFKPYYTETVWFFSQRTALAPASLPRKETSATAATNSDQDHTQAAVAPAKSMAAPQTTASPPKEGALATAPATDSGHDQVSAPNDLSRPPERPVVDTQTQAAVAAAKSMAASQTTVSPPKEEVLATAPATNSDHDQLSATNGLSRPPERPVMDTQTQAAVAAAKSGAVGDVSARQPEGTETTFQGVGDKEILFGMAAPFSGASRELGRQMQIGVETAFSQFNAAGGVNGRLLQLVAADDGYEPGKTADAMHRKTRRGA
jgi:hypothetical protein